ncbi:unnamed protein product [Urochloa decumbens]|uniref:F-box protein At3g26010-like beta-propeller domain-containing protein n=1 Tax=Urochloa decumbens TaxID=240449 RepID=A0ABC9FN96_9POAL
MASRISRPMISNKDIPEEVICYDIFPRLPFKLVVSLKVVSRRYRAQLTDNIRFATLQATLCPSCPALIHIGRSGRESSRYSLDVLSSTPSIVGVPSLGLDFLGCPIDNAHFHILASSNGLLCIRYTPYHIGPLTPPPIIFIANPATQQAQPIPGAPQHLDQNRALGLVFDPLVKQKFMVVQELPFTITNDMITEFRFVTFSSDTGRWVMSDTLITTNIKPVRCDKVVYASGVLYWDYGEDLLWFDVSRSVTGSIKMPWKLQESNFEGWEHHSIYVSNNGMLMCTTINKDGLTMYQLMTIGDHCWELKHKNGWKNIMETSGDAFQFCHSMKLRNGWQKIFCERWFVRPLGLENGRLVYLGVRLKWKTPDRVLRYDMDSGKVDNIGKELGNAFDWYCAFGYRNSMAALPPIEVPKLQDGFCDGKSGGCICAIEGNTE